jgi:hypothetical protein
MQLPSLHRSMQEAAKILGVEPPELYIRQVCYTSAYVRPLHLSTSAPAVDAISSCPTAAACSMRRQRHMKDIQPALALAECHSQCSDAGSLRPATVRGGALRAAGAAHAPGGAERAGP